jgi:hypothetical protein
MPAHRKIKQFAVYVRTHFIDTSGDQTIFTYFGGTIYTSERIDGTYNTMNGTAKEHWRLVHETDSLDEAIDKIRELMHEGHALPMINLNRKIEMSQYFKILS